MTRARWRLRAGLCAAMVGALLLGTPTTASADPDDQLAVTSSTRYEVDGEGPVRVTVTTTLRNEKPDVGREYYFWKGYGIPVPAGVDDVSAKSAGASLPVTYGATDDPMARLAEVSFDNLMYGKERTIEWSYTIPGDPIRSDGRSRVGPGYATFLVVGMGDSGKVSVEIVTPLLMSFDSTWDGFTSDVVDGSRVHRATESTDAYGTWAFVSMRNPWESDPTTIEAGDTELVLESLPGDTEWADFVAEQVDVGLPVLERAVGMSWPGDLERIREDVSPGVLGYAWYDSVSGEIVVPEDLDAGLLFHELSHAWLNDEAFTDRWVYEGLAELVGERVAAETGGATVLPTAPSRDAEGALPLATWRAPLDQGGYSATEEYAYAAAWTVMSELLGELDEATLGEIVAAAYAGESAYDEPGSSDHTGRTNGQRFLDLVEARGQVTDAAEPYRTWVADTAEGALLDARGPAREAYVALDEADGDWSPPAGLRAAMTDWEFDAAESARTAIGDDAAAAAGQVQEAARAAGLPEPTAVREQYESAETAEEYAELATVLPRAVEVVGSVGDAVSAGSGGGAFGDLGRLLLDVDGTTADARAALDDGRLDDAAAAAGTASSRAAVATWLGGSVVFLALVVVAGAVVLVVWLVRRRGRAAQQQAAALAVPVGLPAPQGSPHPLGPPSPGGVPAPPGPPGPSHLPGPPYPPGPPHPVGPPVPPPPPPPPVPSDPNGVEQPDEATRVGDGEPEAARA